PEVSRFALLLKPDAAPGRTIQGFRKEADVAARALGVHLQILEARGPEDFDRAFSDLSEARVGALAVLVTGAFISARQRLVDLAAKHRLPTVFSFRDFVDAG